MGTEPDHNTHPPAEQPSPAHSDRLAFLVQLLNAVQQSVIAIDREERVIFWNDAATRFHGYTRDEAIRRNVTHLLAGGDAGGARQIIAGVWNGNLWSGECPVSHRDGSTFPARVRLFPILDSSGQISGIVGVSEDISAEVDARNVLHQYQEQIEPLAPSMSDAVWDWDVVTDSFWSNAAYDALVGPRPPGLSVKNAWLARIHPADFPAIQAQTIAAENAGFSFCNEYRFLSHATNRYVRIRDRGFFIRDGGGKLCRIVGSMSDAGRFKDMERAFRASEERFRLVFEESPFGIFLVDRELQILQTNGAFRRMLGYEDEDLLGRSIIDFTHPDDRPGCVQLASGLFNSQHALFRVEKRYVRRDGGVLWCAITAAGLPAPAGTPLLGLAIIEDVTEQKRVRDELSAANVRAEEAMGAKMRFLAQISHEIRSPMNGVLGMLELLDATHLDPEQRDNLTAARQAATSLLGMLEEILDLTRLDQHRLALHPRSYSPRRLVHDLASLYRVKTAAENIELVVSLADGVPEEHTSDPARIRQILVNLLENAVKFTSTGYVSITIFTKDSALCFSVQDTGTGIPAEGLDSVFDVFSAISAHTSARVGGTGLGLAISQRLARLMGGDIVVSSVLGEGSRFTLCLPLMTVDSPETATTAPIATPGSFAGRRILVVEDNIINQRVSAGMLRRLGCEVDVAGNGVEALAKAIAIRYDAILMDAMMPVMDGFDATSEIRRREPAGSHIPIVGLTALASDEDRDRCLAAGMDDYLPKPADFNALSAVLGRWLSGGARH
jgi:PAS domain S-box-containing protein